MFIYIIVVFVCFSKNLMIYNVVFAIYYYFAYIMILIQIFVIDY